MHRAGGADSVGQVRRGDVARDGQMPEKGAFRPGSAVGRANVLVHIGPGKDFSSERGRFSSGSAHRGP